MECLGNGKGNGASHTAAYDTYFFETVTVTGGKWGNFLKLITVRGMEVTNATVSNGTITIDFKDATIGAYITIFSDGSICDAAQNVMEQGARLQVTLVVGESMGFLDKFGEPTFKAEWIK